VGFLVVVALILFVTIVSSPQGSGLNQATPTANPAKGDARLVDPRQLVADPQAFRGQNLYLQGKALNVEQHPDYTWVQLFAQVPGKTSSSTESVVVEFRPKAPAVLKDECYRIYGVGAGTQNVTRTLTGATNAVPYVTGYAYESAPQDQFKFGCASP